MSGRVAGKVAFITGVARGQGRSHAVRLAEEGADIIGTDICGAVGATSDYYPPATQEDLAETVRQVEALGRRIVVRQADVRGYEATKQALDEGVAELGRLDVVVANAGIFQFGDQVHQTSAEAWRDTIDVNLTGVFNTCKASLPHLHAAERGGSMVLISSDAGFKGMPNIGHYVASKHGVIGLMRTLALENAEHAIRVNAVCPTNCDTDMIQNEPMYKLFLPAHDRPTRGEFAEVATTMTALPVPWVDARDISNAVLFLASEEARYVTGVTLPVDAGVAVK